MQVKRVLGSDPALPLNVSTLRELPDPELLRVLLLAVVGNFTTAAADDWQQPCSVSLDPHTGLWFSREQADLASLAQKVILMLLVAAQFKLWVEEARTGKKSEQKGS